MPIPIPETVEVFTPQDALEAARKRIKTLGNDPDVIKPNRTASQTIQWFDISQFKTVYLSDRIRNYQEGDNLNPYETIEVALTEDNLVVTYLLDGNYYVVYHFPNPDQTVDLYKYQKH